MNYCIKLIIGVRRTLSYLCEEKIPTVRRSFQHFFGFILCFFFMHKIIDWTHSQEMQVEVFIYQFGDWTWLVTFWSQLHVCNIESFQWRWISSSLSHRFFLHYCFQRSNKQKLYCWNSCLLPISKVNKIIAVS